MLKLDRKESTKLSLKYRRGKGEILIVSHAGRGWWDPTSEAIHLGDGRWWDEDRGVWRDGQRRALSNLPAYVAGATALLTTKIFLAAAHLDHDPGNNRRGNLKAFCQRCHMLHDRALRRPLTCGCKIRRSSQDLFRVQLST